MLWHDDIRPTAKVVFFQRLVEGLHEPELRTVFGEEEHPFPAREGKKVGVAFIVIVFELATVGSWHGAFPYAGIVSRSTGKLWHPISNNSNKKLNRGDRRLIFPNELGTRQLIWAAMSLSIEFSADTFFSLSAH